ncbi:hypothetical protein ACFE04_002670 [Oxalis oulophora]
MIGILSAYRLPFPSRSFDMAHCSRCLVPWTAHDGMYLIEIDRILRPGGYRVLAGPPIGWKTNYKVWQRPAKDLEKEQISFEDLAKRLCWKKIAEKDSLVAVWQKPTNHMHCSRNSKTWNSPKFCDIPDPDFGCSLVVDRQWTANWYKKMETCITPLPNVKDNPDTSGGNIESWPKRLFHQELSKGLLKLPWVSKQPVWVMNVVPTGSNRDTLGIVYERGLIGTYMDWSDITDIHILLEMNRILRPEGAVIIRDHVDMIAKVKGITDRMRWNGKILHTEKGSLPPPLPPPSSPRSPPTTSNHPPFFYKISFPSNPIFLKSKPFLLRCTSTPQPQPPPPPLRQLLRKWGNAVDKEGYVPVICGLSRCNEKDIKTAWEAVKYAKRPRIHTFIATSGIHMQFKLRKSKAG